MLPSVSSVAGAAEATSSSLRAASFGANSGCWAAMTEKSMPCR